MKNVYEVVTQRIIEELKRGTVPWHKPWRGNYPKNINGRPYRGINAFLLNSLDYTSPYWLTFNQVRQKDGKLKKGSKGMPVVFWKLLEKDEDVIPLLRYYTVFNLEQTEGINPPKAITHKFKPVEACEQVLSNMPGKPKIRHGKAEAYYSPKLDLVNMPKKPLFESDEEYYCVLFHELNHSTGHASRLNRKTVIETTPFGSEDYSKEELIAEMGAAYLCAHCQIENKVIKNSAAYIQNWLTELRNDKRLIITTAAAAQKSADYILNNQP